MKEKVNPDRQGQCKEWRLVLYDSLFSALKGRQQPNSSAGILEVLEDKELRLSQKAKAFNVGYS